MSGRDGATHPVIAARLYLRVDALMHRNPKIGRLSDAQYRAYMTTLCEGKLARSEGEWPSTDHLAFAVGQKAARHLPALIAAGLIEVDRDGWVRVHDWQDYQPKDTQAAERAKRYRDRKRDRATAQRDAERDASRDGRDASRDDRDVTTQTDRGDRSDTAPGATRQDAAPGALATRGPTATEAAQAIVDDPASSPEAKEGARAWLALRQPTNGHAAAAGIPEPST